MEQLHAPVPLRYRDCCLRSRHQHSVNERPLAANSCDLGFVVLWRVDVRRQFRIDIDAEDPIRMTFYEFPDGLIAVQRSQVLKC